MSVVLVAGPPCSGKSTYVRDHAGPDDAVIEFERYVETASPTGDRYDVSPAVRAEAARRWHAEIKDVADAPGRTWVIWAAPRRADRGRFRAQFNAEVIVMMASPATCMERVRQQRPPAWAGYVRRWFEDFEPSKSGRETIIRTDLQEVAR